MPHVRKGIRFEPKQAVMEPPRETYVGGARVRAITVDPRRQMRSVRLFADLRGPGVSFGYSICVSFVFFCDLSASPTITMRDLFTFGLEELVAPVDGWDAVFVGLEVLAGSAGPSTPDGRKKVVPCIEEDDLKSVPTPVMSKMRLFASLEGSLVDFF